MDINVVLRGIMFLIFDCCVLKDVENLILIAIN